MVAICPWPLEEQGQYFCQEPYRFQRVALWNYGKGIARSGDSVGGETGINPRASHGAYPSRRGRGRKRSRGMVRVQITASFSGGGGPYLIAVDKKPAVDGLTAKDLIIFMGFGYECYLVSTDASTLPFAATNL